MGMFDSFYAELECPRCHEVQEFEFQVKLFEKMLNNWHIGDKVPTSIGLHDYLRSAEISSVTFCRSPPCRLQAKAIGINTSLGMMARGEIILKNRKFLAVENFREEDLG